MSSPSAPHRSTRIAVWRPRELRGWESPDQQVAPTSNQVLRSSLSGLPTPPFQGTKNKNNRHISLLFHALYFNPFCLPAEQSRPPSVLFLHSSFFPPPPLYIPILHPSSFRNPLPPPFHALWRWGNGKEASPTVDPLSLLLLLSPPPPLSLFSGKEAKVGEGKGRGAFPPPPLLSCSFCQDPGTSGPTQG